jgi:ClpP class serine protease
MGGERAKELGLIDEVGGLSRAVALARERGKLSKNAAIVRWPEAETPLSALGGLFGAHAANTRMLSELSVDPLAAQPVIHSALLRALTHPAPYAIASLPFLLRIE